MMKAELKQSSDSLKAKKMINDEKLKVYEKLKQKI